MGPNIICVLIVLLFTIISCTSAYNITYLLSNHPELSTLNYLLTKTGMDKTINNMKSTITVLAVDNSAMGSLSGQSLSSQQTMLETHLLLDYFDTYKLKEMKTNRTVTNLYQKSGKATGQQGSVNIAKNGDNVIFYSAVDGAPKSSKLVKEVGSKPFDIIVLQINTPIVVPGLNGTPIAAPAAEPPSPLLSLAASHQSSSTPAPAHHNSSSTPAPSPQSSSVPAPAPAHHNSSSVPAPAPSPQSSSVPAPGPEAPAPEFSIAPAPAPGPDAEPPAADDEELADGPDANSSPAPSPDLTPEEAPVVDDVPDKSPNKNGGGRIMANAGGLVVGLILALAL